MEFLEFCSREGLVGATTWNPSAEMVKKERKRKKKASNPGSKEGRKEGSIETKKERKKGEK